MEYLREDEEAPEIRQRRGGRQAERMLSPKKRRIGEIGTLLLKPNANHLAKRSVLALNSK